MASSSSDMKGKGHAVSSMEGGGVVLSPNPVSSVRPAENSCHEVEYASYSKRVLKRSTKLSDSYVSFTLSEAEADYVKRMDEVCRGLSTGDKTESRIPMEDRLAGWTIETRQRLGSTKKIEPFFHHPHLSRALRSKKHVVHFICYGSVPPSEKGKIKKSPKAENEGCGKRKRMTNERKNYQTEKESVEAFLAESYSNLMNLAPQEVMPQYSEQEINSDELMAI